MVTFNHWWIHKTFGPKQWYYVGGCVRDRLMGRTPKDYDIATDLTPDEVEALFVAAGHRVVRTGEGFGGVTLVGPEGERIECTTYRADGVYLDARRPSEVRFAKTIQEDLSRRDFTANAMAEDPITGDLVDPYGGANDIRRGIIRCVGDPNERFREDALRILRAARFAAQLRFEVERETKAAMTKNFANLLTLPVERVREEILKAMRGVVPTNFWLVLYDTEVLPWVQRELWELVGLEQPQEYHAFDAFVHSLETLSAISAEAEDPVLRYIAVMHDIGKAQTFARKENGQPSFINHEDMGVDMIVQTMRKLKFPNDDIERAKTLIKWHLVPYDGSWSDATIRKWRERVGEYWDDLMMLRRADLKAHGTDVTEKLRLLAELDERVRTLKEKKIDVTPPLAITGHDVMRLRGASGREVGRILGKLRDIVTEDPSKNTRETLESLISNV